MSQNKRIEARNNFEEVCEKIMEERGSLRDSLALCYEVRHEIEKCYAIGVTSVEVHTILTKFGQFLS